MNTLKNLRKIYQNSILINQQKFSMRQRNKVVGTLEEALEGVESGNFILVGGFGCCGTPNRLIEGVRAKGIKNLTVASNNAGLADWGLGILMQDKQIKKMYSSYVGENKLFEKQYLEGDLEVELTPQGTLAEKLRCGGAGIPAFFTPTGANTYVEEGKVPIKFKKGTNGTVPEILSKPREKRIFNGREYIMEESLFADVALIKAWKADTDGNLIYRDTANNFNENMAGAAKLCIVEAEEIYKPGELDPTHIHTQAIYVDRIFQCNDYIPKLEKPVFDHSDDPIPEDKKSRSQLVREKIIKRAAQEVKDGMYINLGIGIPTLLPAFLPKGVIVSIESEIGVLGVGNYPKPGQEHPDLVNAGKESITLAPGASVYSSAQSFSMIRGGHLDLTMLGAMQISENCDISNWIIPGKMVKGMGGAMDLVSCGSKVIVVMEHTAKGDIKLMKENSLPLTGKGVVDKVITNLAVFEKINGKLQLTEIAHDTTLEEVKRTTGFEINVKESDLKRF